MSNQNKYTDEEVEHDPELQMRALQLISEYKYHSGSFPWLDRMKDRSLHSQLTVPQLRGILNCLDPRWKQKKSEDEPKPKLEALVKEPSVFSEAKYPATTKAKIKPKYVVGRRNQTRESDVAHQVSHGHVVWYAHEAELYVTTKCGKTLRKPTLYRRVRGTVNKQGQKLLPCQLCNR